MSNSDHLKETLTIENVPHLMEQTIIDMVINPAYQFFGEFTFYLNIHEDNTIPTCGVGLRRDGCFVLKYNKEFVEKLSKEEITFLLIHEVFHLLWDHIKRSVGYDEKLSNLAQDMLINQCIHDDLICKEQETNIKMPQDEKGHNSGVFVPKEYNGELIFEDLYNWLKKDFEKWQKEKKTSSNGEGEGDGISGPGEGNSEPEYGPFGKSIGKNPNPYMYSKESFYENLENSKGMTMDVHSLDELPPEIKKDLIEKILNACKNRGILTASIEQLLGKIQKTEHDYLKDIKRSLTHSILGSHKEKSITRPNRRGIWGLKGKRKYSYVINVIHDTSGSMANEHDFVLSYIFQSGIEINHIMIDTEVKAVYKIKKKEDLLTMKVKGFGGTTLSPALNFIAKNSKLNKNNIVILTDGYTDTLDFTGINGKCLIISTAVECKIKNANRDVKQIIIEKHK